MKQSKRLFSILLTLVMLFSLLPGMSGTAYASSYISNGMIDVNRDSGTVSSDMTCTYFSVFDSATLIINQGVTLTLNISNGYSFSFFDRSKMEVHGTLAGSVASGADWFDRTYINVYLSDGAKYTVTGLSCMDGDNYLVYYGYDAATDGNGTVSVKNGSTDVTSTSTGYKTTTYTFTATPNSGYKFKNWTKGPGGEVLGTDASINVTCEQNGQYQVYANFESDKTAQTITASDVTATYGDTGKKIEVTTSGDGAIGYAVKSGDAVTVDGTTGALTIVKAGSAVITVTAAETATYAQATKDVNVTVNTKAMTVTAADVNVAVDGQPHGITVNVTDPASGATVKYGTEAGTYNLDASPTQTEAGELTVYYQVTADNYTTYTGSAKVTVNAKQTQTITASDVTATYGDTGKSVSGTTTGDGAISYSVKSGDAVTVDENTGALTIVKAGSAVITVTAAETATYAQATKDVTVTINKADPAYTVPTGLTATYGQTLADVTLPDGWTWADGSQSVGNAGTNTFKANYTPTDTANYNSVENVDVSVNVTKANITPSVSIEGWTYGEAAKTPVVSGNTGNGTVSYAYAVKGGTDFSSTAPTDAGDYTVKATVAATTNYNGGEATADFTIAKATVTVTADAKSKTYGETDPALTYTASALVGSDALTGALTREAGENARTYAIGQGTLSAGDNYTISYTGANFTINKAAITITADDKSGKFGNDLAELTYTVSGAYKAGDELGVTLNTTASKTADVGEYPITVDWNDNANYDATLVNGKYTITQTDLTVTAAGYTGTYDKAAHGISVDVGSSGATVYYAAEALTAENYTTAGSTTALTYTDAGEYTVYYYVVSKNYKPDTVSGSKTVSISKATMTKDELTAAQKPTAKTDLIADNTDQVLLTAPEALPEGYTKIQYSIDNGETWTDTIPTGKDPGDTTVLTKYIGDKNHADFEGEAVTATIKTLTVTFEVNGGSAVAAQNVIKGEKATKPADPTKAGNAFDGWFQDATFSVAFDFDTPVTADMTIYAKWTPNDYSFQTITGTTTDASHSWTKGTTADVVITVKLTTEPDNSFAHYVRTEIDGKTVTAAAREGSTIVTIKAAELQKLSTGAHTVTIVFDNGQVDVKLTVKPNPSSPSIGDTRTTGLWAVLTVLSGIGLGGVTVLGKKRRKSIGR